MEFGSDVEMQKVSHEAREFFEEILSDEEPLFVSDEATIWDLSMSTADELLERCSTYYGTVLAAADLKLDCLPFVAPQQRIERDWVGAIVLFQNAQQAPACGVAKHHRFGLQHRGGAFELDVVHA